MNKIPDKYVTFLICLALALSTLVVFWQVRHHQFISFDDDWYIFDNSHIVNGLTWDNVLWFFSHDHGGNYHPLTAISHMLDCNLYGLDAGGHHFTNLLFHLANALLLFLVFKSMTANLWASAFIAALFALHPLHVESVAWASERKDVLSTFFGLLTMAAYIRYVRKSDLRSYLLTILLFALGLLAKPMLVTLPFLLLLLDYWPLERVTPGSRPVISGWRRIIIEKIPFLVLAAVIGAITFSIQKDTGITQDIAEYPMTWRIGNAATAYITYIIKMFWPVNLAIFYPHPRSSLSSVQAGLAFFLLVCITALALWQVRKRPWFAVGWLWFAISLFPVIGLVQVGLQAWADRYTYMSYTGLFIIVVWGVPELLARFRYKNLILALVAGASILVLAVASWFQVGYWQDNEKLYEHATKVVKDNWWARHNLGREFVNQGKLDQAVEQFTKALRVYPDNANIKNDLAKTFLKQGMFEQASELYQEFLPPLPEDLNLVSQVTDNELFRQRRFTHVLGFFAEGQVNLAIALMQQGKYDESVKHFTVALQLRPELVRELKDVAVSLLRQGKPAEAEKLYQQILQILPEDLDVHNGLGLALDRQGRLDEAVREFRGVLRISPDRIDAMITLARLISVNKDADFYDPNEAIHLAQRACAASDYQKPELLDTLAIAYAAVGRFQDAVETADKAFKLAQSSQQEQLALQIQARLNLYKAGESYIESATKGPAEHALP
jgi:tetratricopeptide (TPR) repeat protein